MRRLRQALLLRLLAGALLVSLGVGVAAPVAAAGRVERPAPWLPFEAIPQATLEAALSAAAGAETPEAYAEALAAALRAALGDAAPPADALLAALYGQLFRVLQEEVGGSAVMAADASGAVQTPLGGPPAPGLVPGTASIRTNAVAGGQEPLPTPRTLRPALQPLGP